MFVFPKCLHIIVDSTLSWICLPQAWGHPGQSLHTHLFTLLLAVGSPRHNFMSLVFVVKQDRNSKALGHNAFIIASLSYQQHQ